MLAFPQADLDLPVYMELPAGVNPMRSHKLAIMRTGRYLCNNCERGIIYKVDKSKGIKVYVDADFAGGWSSADAENANNVLLHTGFHICYPNCPIIWCSKLSSRSILESDRYFEQLH